MNPSINFTSNSQNYNRFSYVLNNPLKYVDPSGYVAMNPWYEYQAGPKTKFYTWMPEFYEEYLDNQGRNWKYYGETINTPGFYGDETGMWISKLNEHNELIYNYNELRQIVQNNANSNNFFSSFSMGAGTFRVEGEGGNGRNNPSGQGGPGWEPIVGTAGAIAGEMYYSKTYGTWMGKNFKMYQQTWGGNGATGGKLKFGKKVSTGIKIGGYGLGVWNAYKIDQQNRTGQITDGQMYMEQGSNLITTVGGLYGAAWGVGWELGRAVTNMEWYQEAKFNFWYNRWESQVGPPSQSNEALWYYFYQNYKP